jgi:hypothetical protein
VPPQQLRDIERFFVSHNEAQGRKFTITGRFDAAAANRVLDSAISSVDD